MRTVAASATRQPPPTSPSSGSTSSPRPGPPLATGAQVVAGDMEAVAKAVLAGVEEALKDKRKELMQLREKESVTVVVDYRTFTREVNVVVR